MRPVAATRMALFALGFLSIGTQVSLLREFMMIFGGNELLLGVLLSFWMLETGAGALLGRYLPPSGNPHRVAILMGTAGLLPPLMFHSLALSRAFLVPYGAMPELSVTTSVALLAALPFCLLNGYIFIALSLCPSAGTPGSSYAWESLGSLASGATVILLFTWLPGTETGIWLLTGVYMAMVALWTVSMTGLRFAFPWVALLTVILILQAATGFVRLAEDKLYPFQALVSKTETPYGRVIVTATGSQYNYYSNGHLLFSSGNETANEESVHFVMAQRPGPRDVLMISGSFSGTMAEVLKYRPDRVDCLEPDKALAGIGMQIHGAAQNPVVRMFHDDPKRFLQEPRGKYDVVMVGIPSPATLGLNRYFTDEFISVIKQHIKPSGVIAYGLPSTGEYISAKAGALQSTLYQTLAGHFSHILVIAGGRNYFLASDRPLSADIPGLIDSAQIPTLYVNSFYLDAGRLKERSALLTEEISDLRISGGEKVINLNFKPVMVYQQTGWWLSHFSGTSAILIMVAILLLVAATMIMNPVSAGLFTGGFTVASAEVMILFGLQVLTGYLFQAVGAIIMIFMLGLALGAAPGLLLPTNKFNRAYLVLQTLMAMLAVLIPVILTWPTLGRSGPGGIMITLGILALLVSMVAGMQYRMASSLPGWKPSLQLPVNYPAELFGAAAGALLASMVLIPLTGLLTTGCVLAVLNLLSALFYFLAGRKGLPSGGNF